LGGTSLVFADVFLVALCIGRDVVGGGIIWHKVFRLEGKDIVRIPLFRFFPFGVAKLLVMSKLFSLQGSRLMKRLRGMVVLRGLVVRGVLYMG